MAFNRELACRNLARMNDARAELSRSQKRAAAYNMLDPAQMVECWARLMYDAEHVPLDDLPRVKLKWDMLSGMMRKVMPDLKQITDEEVETRESTIVHMSPEDFEEAWKRFADEGDF